LGDLRAFSEIKNLEFSTFVTHKAYITNKILLAKWLCLYGAFSDVILVRTRCTIELSYGRAVDHNGS